MSAPPVPARPVPANEGIYPAVCASVFVFLCTLPLTGVPDEALGWRFVGFLVTGLAAGGMSTNGGAALLGLAAGHVVMLLLPQTAPASIGGHAYATLASALLVAGMWAGHRLASRRMPRLAAGAPFAVPGPLVLMAGVATGLFPFAFARPNPEGALWTLGIPIGFAAVVLLGVLAPGDAQRAWAWFLLGHTPFLLLEFLSFLAPGLIVMAVSWFGVWWGSVLAANGAGVAPPSASVPSASARSAPVTMRGGGGRMG